MQLLVPRALLFSNFIEWNCCHVGPQVEWLESENSDLTGSMMEGKSIVHDYETQVGSI